MSPALWGAGIILAVLFMAASCGDPDPPEDPVPTPTVTATATFTATPDPVVRVRTVVPDACRLAAGDARILESALFDYEEAVGGLSEIHDLTATGIASRDIHRLNKARELLSLVQSDSTAALQILLTELDDLRTHNKMCREELRR